MLNNTGRYELRRFAIAPDAPKNTGSRLLKIMAQLIQIIRPDARILISYQDTSVHKGSIYAAAGWKPVFRSKGHEWSCKSRPDRAQQSAADKVRWELCLPARQRLISGAVATTIKEVERQFAFLGDA